MIKAIIILVLFNKSEDENKLVALEDLAKSQGKGRWSKSDTEAQHVRNIKWNVGENPTNFVDSFHYKPINGN